jgi:hypothetical protein
VLLLLAANTAFFVFKFSETGASSSIEGSGQDIEDAAANWVAFAPDFEAAQRADPQKFGVHEGATPIGRPEVIDGQQVSQLSSIAGQCAIERYVIRNRNDSDEFMPDRLFAYNLSSDQQDCLLESLPDGYRLARLSIPIRPSRVSWSQDLSSLIANEGANAQKN